MPKPLVLAQFRVNQISGNQLAKVYDKTENPVSARSNSEK